MQIKINPYFVGKTHITKTHIHQVISGVITVVNLVNGKKIISTYKKGDYIYLANPITHFIVNNTNKIVTLKLVWMSTIGKYLDARQSQTEILFFTGFSCNKKIYQNLIKYFDKHITNSFGSFLTSSKKKSIKITICDWTKEVYQKGLESYLDRISRNCTSPKVILIAHSWGCQIAARFAVRNLKKIKRLFLMDYHPLKAPIHFLKSKKSFIEGFFPKCSRQDLTPEMKLVSNSINIKYISVSDNLLESHAMGNQLKNIPSTLIYATGITIKNNNIAHYCVTEKNRKKLIKMNTTHFQKVQKNIEYITIYRGSHFWFMDNKYEKIMLNMWKSICNTLVTQ